MNALKDELVRIREAANSIEVKGEKNASYILYITSHCNALLKVLDQLEAQVLAAQNGEEPDVEETEEGVDAEQN